MANYLGAIRRTARQPGSFMWRMPPAVKLSDAEKNVLNTTAATMVKAEDIMSMAVDERSNALANAIMYCVDRTDSKQFQGYNPGWAFAVAHHVCPENPVRYAAAAFTEMPENLPLNSPQKQI
ncbi:MAG: hypothetical protein ABIE84_03535 [bacterium]